ncbi:MAG: DNA-processing protein DprA [Burkholderiaceae bacterium]
MPPEATPAPLPPAAPARPGPSRATSRRLPDPDAADWLRLALVDGLGPGRILHLLRTIGAPSDILASPTARLAAILGADIATRIVAADPAREERVARSLAWLAAEPDRQLLRLDDPAYPSTWLCLADPPPCVMVQGRLEALAAPAIAIVGSRHASAGGMRSARDFAAGLVGEGWAVASGLAQGIDAAAHAGALGADGRTIAFVGTGLDLVYPARHRELAARIAATGAIVSEFPLGTPALRSNFPRRNRLIAAHSRGVLVVEAARRSGSLITARQAADLGREVFAVPGSVHSPLSHGCHWLIRQGACLVEELADIRDEIPAALRPPVAPRPPEDGAAMAAQTPAASGAMPGFPGGPTAAAAHEEDTGGPAAAATLAGLDWHPASLDELAQRLGFAVSTLLAALCELELAGRVERLADGRYQRCRPDHLAAGVGQPDRSARVARRVDRPV